MAEDYKEIKELGHGGFGKVYLIEKNNKYYALKKLFIKELNEEEKEKCKNEIIILRRFNNENIVKFYDSYIKNEYMYIIMEYAGDSNLKKFIKKYKDRDKFIPEELIYKIVLQICIGLKEIHENKIIHRDLTPDNIFINEKNYKIKIGDFGISKILDTINKYSKSTIGKYKYFAKELEEGKNYDIRVDIYSLGCIIYELLSRNEYYIDKKYNIPKVNEIYNEKWENLINLLLKDDYHRRPNIEMVYNYIINFNKNNINEIKITINVDSLGKVYFLNNTDDKDELTKLKEINESNTEIYINGIKSDFQKYFLPKKFGKYIIIIKLLFNITNCSYMFYHCNEIESIDLSSFNTENVKDMNHMFYYCFNLKNIKLPFFNTENELNMKYMFSFCSSIKSLDFLSFNTIKVTNMEGMFKGCNYIKNINLSSFNTKNLKNLSKIFSGCWNLENIDLTSFNTENVDDMNNMFSCCRNLIHIDLSSSFNTINVKDMKEMFSGCQYLKSLDLSTFNTINVKDMSNMFNFCENIENIYLTKKFNTTNVTNMAGMFSGCENLKSVDLSSFDTKNVIDMSGMFKGCSSLFSIDLSSFNTKNVKCMFDMFCYCFKLKSIVLNSFDTKNVISMSYMFYECNDLESIDLSSFDIIKVSYMENMFSEEEKTLKEIKVNKYSFDKFKKEFPYLIGVFKKIN